MKVESKYKNPDKFVKRLRKEIERQEHALTLQFERGRRTYHTLTRERMDHSRDVKREVNVVWGEWVNTWADGIGEKLGAGTLTLGVFNPGDTVILVGTVTKVVKTKKKESEIFFDRVETRRRDHE